MALSKKLMLSAVSAIVASAAHSASLATRSVLYVEGMWDNSYTPAQELQYAHDVAGSGFNTVVLAFAHFTSGRCLNSKGQMTPVYNNICFSDATTLPQVMKILKAPNSTVREVLISIGGAGAN